MKIASVLPVLSLSFGVAISPPLPVWAAPPEPQPEPSAARIFTLGLSDLASFEQEAKIAKELGATHVVITNNLPPALWELSPPNDPYPAWYMYGPDFLKIFPPKEVQPFVDLKYADRVAQLLEDRCRILGKLGLKAFWTSNAPQTMPEAFFTAYPELRGPRVDQPNRSRIARFAPCVDQPETLRLYREAMQSLLQHCPEVEIFSFFTTDCGAGFCWTPGLYPGMNGPNFCKDRPMAERVSGFLIDLQQAAHDVGHSIEICINPIIPRQWMLGSFNSPMDIVKLLPAGLAVQNREGLDGRPFMAAAAFGAGNSPFYPLVGIAYPTMGAYPATLGGRRTGAARELVDLGDEESVEFNASLYRAVGRVHPKNELERLAKLREFAVALAGDAQADTLMSLWSSLNEVQRRLDALDFGSVLEFGMMLGRWINRPLVPFPSELGPREKSYYRPYLFQAKGEAQADDLTDIQAMRMYEGWSAHLLFQRVIEVARPSLQTAISDAGHLADAANDAASRERWRLLRTRLEVLDCLMQTADNVVAYQAQLDQVKRLGGKPEANPVLGTQSSWDRTDLMAIARKEIDNTIQLRRLLGSTRLPLLDLASTPAEETIFKLSPDLPTQLKYKIDIMNSSWGDYDRLFTAPNP